jgi:hypothetical protein
MAGIAKLRELHRNGSAAPDWQHIQSLLVSSEEEQSDVLKRRPTVLETPSNA